MRTSMSWAARPTVRFAGLAAGVVLLLGACGEQVPEGGEPPATSGSLTPPAASHQMAALPHDTSAQ